MAWKGMFFGAVVGLLITRSAWGAVIGAIIGQMFDQGVVMRAVSYTHLDVYKRQADKRSVVTMSRCSESTA